MRHLASKLVLAAMGAAIVSAGAATARTSSLVEGQVTAVHVRAMAGTEQRFTEVTLRTRQRDQLRVRLGLAESAPPCAAGDRVRLRVARGGSVDGALQARAMWNRETGQRYRFRDGNGDLVRERIRDRARDGSCDGVQRRDRRHQSEGNSRGGRRGGSTARGGGR